MSAVLRATCPVCLRVVRAFLGFDGKIRLRPHHNPWKPARRCAGRLA